MQPNAPTHTFETRVLVACIAVGSVLGALVAWLRGDP